MNRIILIGNGFDLAQGLKTRYADFYPYYQKCPSPNEAAKLMKKEINEHAGDWSDMELALGKFTKEVPSEEELTDMYFDLSERLSEYLTEESQRKAFTHNNKVLMDFFEPSRYLEPLDQRYYRAHFNTYYDRDKRYTQVNIISLNYTNTLESLLGPAAKRGASIGNGFYRVDNICHRHGMLGDTILLGVNDEQQILNESFKNSQSTKNFLVKPMAIDAMRSDNDVICKEMIQSANIIGLFGVSLGETDANLWKDVVDHLSQSDTLLLYFHHTKDIIPQNKKQLLGVKESQARDYLYERMGLPEHLQSKTKILIGYNKDIFKVEDKKVTSQSGKFEDQYS